MKVETVCGIDPSSVKIVVVETDRDHPRIPIIHEIKLNEEHVEEALSHAFDFIFEICMNIRERTGKPPRLYLEQPVMGGSAKGGFRPGPTIAQSYVSGAIMTAAAQAGCSIMLVNNSTWKKKILKNGNIAKENIGAIVKTLWPELYKKAPIIHAKQHGGKIPNDSPCQDTLDAGCINLFGWEHVKMIERLKKRREG